MTKIGGLTLHVSKDPISTAKDAAVCIYEYIKNARRQGKNILFLTSGGSAFSILNHFPEDTYASDLTIGVLDERFDETNNDNNFSEFKKTNFYTKAKDKGCTFIDTQVKSGQTFEDFTQQFEIALKEWKKENPNGIIIATIGVGTDGHTSGIMPFPEDTARFNELFTGKSWVTSYDAEGKNPYPLRATTTLTFLKTIDHPVVYITGKDKGKALYNMAFARSTAEIPAQFLLTLRGDVYVDKSLHAEIAPFLNLNKI